MDINKENYGFESTSSKLKHFRSIIREKVNVLCFFCIHSVVVTRNPSKFLSSVRIRLDAPNFLAC